MVRIIPLGGLGEFGLNAMVLESGSDRLLIDCGLMFPSAQMPGVGTVVPDLSMLLAEPERLKGVVLTHGHEDHVGALSTLLERVHVPVYGLPFTLGVARSRVEESGLSPDFRDIGPNERIPLGDRLSIELFRVVHSMPDAAAVVIRTPDGAIVHTGDFKLDDDPVDGLATDLDGLGEVGDEGVLCLLSDSTGAEYATPTAGERQVERAFAELFPRAKGRIFVSMFASNVHRLRHTLELCARLDKKVVLAGRSLVRNVDLARRLGLMKVPDDLIIPIEAANQFPESRIVVLATGSQAEPNSALVQMAHGTYRARVPFSAEGAPPRGPGHAHVHAGATAEAEVTEPGLSPLAAAGLTIRAGDLVILSARPIPGNERVVGLLIDSLLERGASVIHGGSHPEVHVSGHATRPQQQQMISAVRPQHFVPIHGELRMLQRHLTLARECGIAPDRTLLARDGDILQFENGHGFHAGHVEVGRVFKDRWGDGHVEPSALVEREKLAELGIVCAALVVDRSRQRIVSGPHLTGRGLSREEVVWLDEVAHEARKSLDDISPALLGDEAFVREELSRAVRRAIRQRTRKRSAVLPLVIKL